MTTAMPEPGKRLSTKRVPVEGLYDHLPEDDRPSFFGEDGYNVTSALWHELNTEVIVRMVEQRYLPDAREEHYRIQPGWSYYPGSTNV